MIRRGSAILLLRAAFEAPGAWPPERKSRLPARVRVHEKLVKRVRTVEGVERRAPLGRTPSESEPMEGVLIEPLHELFRRLSL